MKQSWADYHDLDCPFSNDEAALENYFSRFNAGEMGDAESEVFDVRMLQLFCMNAYAGKSPPEWVMLSLANAFTKMLAGGDWCDEVVLPWVPMNPVRSITEDRKLRIYCEVTNRLRNDHSAKVTHTIEAVASEFNCSFSTARHEYFEQKKVMNKKEGMK